jgi:CRP-like cAMP-binding protein
MSPGDAGNEILSSLPATDLDALRAHLHRVTLTSGQILQEAHSPILDVFFVARGMVSLTVETDDHFQIEVGLTGREGFIGASVILNPAPIAMHRAFVQARGFADRMTTQALRTALGESTALRERCLRHVESLLVQTAQVAACNARHPLPDRLARWLLMIHDRMDSDVLPVTHEALAAMLGVRRAGVSVAASTLEAGGLIRSERGRVIVLDRTGLTAASCDCYRVFQQMRDMNSEATTGRSVTDNA